MKYGTSSLIVAAFIGPGTVLTCATAGLRYGYQLGWVLVFATVAVFILQSFTAGTGILAGKGLGEAIRDEAGTRIRKIWMYGLVILGLGIGCAAFESGNLAGTSAGLRTLWGIEENAPWMVFVVSGLAALLLLLDVKRIIQLLAGLVGLMSILFIASALMAPVDWSSVAQGLFVPSMPPGSIVTVVALIGTTIVTYNLFLHPSATKVYWRDKPRQTAWRRELLGMALFIPLGGLISLAILVAGASVEQEPAAAGDVAAFAALLEPAAGSMARYFFGFGLLAAGLTSAVTAPLAAAAGICELFSWETSNANPKYLAMWIFVVAAGLFFNLTGISPLNIIIAAQAANGVLLPLIAGFVWYLSYKQNDVRLPGWYMVLGGGITAVCAGLGIRTLSWVWNQLGL